MSTPTTTPIYGALAPHRGIDELSDGTVLIRMITSAAGVATIDGGTVYASPRLKDISYKMLGTLTQFKNMSGGTGGHSVSDEGVEITFNILPVGSTKAVAATGTNVFRVGAPVLIKGAPVKKGIGHDAASGLYADLFNNSTDGTSITSNAEIAIVTENNMKVDSEGNYSGGTLTVQRKVGHTSYIQVQ